MLPIRVETVIIYGCPVGTSEVVSIADSRQAFDVAAAVFTHAGKRRELNEDNFVADFPLFVVADGMGGHERGEVASEMVAATLPGLLRAAPVTVQRVRQAIAECNRRVHLEGHGDGGMGTTLTGLVVQDDLRQPALVLLNVGDSRTYRMRGGQLVQLSIDHSVVQELITAGVINAAEAVDHPERNVITRAVGIEPEVDADVVIVHPAVGDRYLVCSDGLSNEVPFELLAECLRLDAVGEAAAQLRTEVLATNARDNVTVIVLDVVALRQDESVIDLDRTDPSPRVARPAAVLIGDASAPRADAPTQRAADGPVQPLIADVPPATQTAEAPAPAATVIIEGPPPAEPEGGSA